jgi:hypothetical protein
VLELDRRDSQDAVVLAEITEVEVVLGMTDVKGKLPCSPIHEAELVT